MPIVDLSKSVRKDLTFSAGDSVRVVLTFKNLPSGVAIPVDAYTDSVAPIFDLASGADLGELAIDYTDAATGVLVLTVPASVTPSLVGCQVGYFLRLIHATTPETHTKKVLHGTLTAKPDREVA